MAKAKNEPFPGLDKVSTEALHAEIKRREEARKLEEVAEREAHHAYVKSNIDVLLPLAPRHECGRTTQYDSADNNPNDTLSCPRCCLLYLKKFNYVDDDRRFSIVVESDPVAYDPEDYR